MEDMVKREIPKLQPRDLVLLISVFSYPHCRTGPDIGNISGRPE